MFMSETHHPAAPSGEPNLGDSTVDAPASVEAGDVLALNGVLQSTDDTPTIISRNGPRSAQDDPTGGLRGRKLAHFELIEPIGVGGMAAVIRARDMQLDRLVALKILPPDMAADPENVRRFHQEARSAARLDHENVARVFFCGEDQRLHFIAFEFVEGDNLRAIMERRGRLPVAEALHYVLQVAAGIAHAAERGVVHRDIKPSNIIITPTGLAKLVDMGLARSLERQDDKGLTQSGVTLGTFDYISPEQALEPREADVRSDIYSLGCTLYHVLTGQPPVPEGTAAKKLHHHHHIKPRDPREVVPGLPDEVAVILDHMMAKKPQDRYQSPEQLVHHLLMAARKLGAPANVPEGMLSVEAALPPPPGGRPLLLTGIAAVMVVALIIVLEVFNRTPAATSNAGQTAANTDSTLNGSGISTKSGSSSASRVVKDSTSPDKPQDSPAVTPVVAPPFSGGDATALLDWIKKADKDAPKEITLDQDIILPDTLETGLALSGPKVTIQAKSTDRRPTIRFSHDVRPQGANIWTAVSIDSPDVAVRGVRILVDGRSADVSMVGLRLRSPGPNGVFNVDNCEFIQARPGRGEKRLASLEAIGDDAAPRELALKECRFLSFEGRDNDTLTNQVFGGDDAVVRNGWVNISADDCAFGPHTALFRLQGGKNAKPTLLVEHCSMLLAGGANSAAFNILSGADANLDVRACLFSRPDEAGADPALGQAVVIRQADPGGVVYQDHDNCYHGLNTYWVGGGADQSSWEDFQLRTGGGKSHVLVVSPWKNDPLAPLQKYNYKEDPEDYFASAFQVNEQMAELRVSAYTPIGVRRLGGVSYVAQLAAVDKQAEKALLKRRVVDPTRPSETAKRLYKTLEEALLAYETGDEIVLRWNGAQAVQPIRFDRPRLQDVTIHPDVGFHPVLRLAPGEDRDAEPALFHVYDGSLKLEGLGFILQPNDGFRRQSVIDLAGQGQCSLKNCLVTLDRSLMPPLTATLLAVASLSDPGKSMMQPTRPADQSAQLNLDGCFIRGDGDLIDCQTSRPLDLKANNTLVALKGSFLNVEIASDAPTASATGQMTLTLTRVTTYLTGNLIHLRAGKDYHALAAVRCSPTDCMFVAAAKEPQSLVHLDDSDFPNKEEVHDKLILWGADGGHTVYGNYGTMLDQSPPSEGMPLMVSSDKWESIWGKDTGKLVKPFRFGPAQPPAADAPFTTAAPLQFRPLDPLDSGADVSRLEQTLPPVGSAK
jgi:serine/threonine protein kinase